MNTKTVIIAVVVILAIAVSAYFWFFAGTAPSGLVPAPTPAGTEGAPVSLNETAAYYEITASYPSSIGLSAQADAKAVTAMKKFEEDAIAQFKKDGNFENLSHDDVQILGLDQRKMSLDITYTAKRGTRTTSYVFARTVDTFGAHPNTFYKTFTFANDTGATLSLADVFTPGTNYLVTLSNESRARLPAAIAANIGGTASDFENDMLAAGTTAKEENFRNWYIDGSTLVLVFEPYQVAAYAAGTQYLSLPLSDLPVRPDYR